MGLGQDKIAAEVFNIEPTAVVDLFRVYPDIVNFPDTYFNMHNGSVFGIGITWQGEDYMPVSMEYEGFEVTSDGRPNRPLMRFSNSQYFASSLLDKYDDFSNGRIQRKRTFVKFLDDSNFEGGNPWGESDAAAEISDDIYIVSQKKRENKDFVEVELTTPLDLESFEVNHRRILGKYCYWKYRGPGCQYQGKPRERLDRQPFLDQNNIKIEESNVSSKAKFNNTSYIGGDFSYGKAGDLYRPTKKYYKGNIIYKINDRVRIQDEEDPNSFYPLLVYYVCKADKISGEECIGKDPNIHPEYWDKDGCSKTLSACKSHFNDIRQVQVGVNTKKYSQEVLNIQEASKTHMTIAAPDAGLEGLFNWSFGLNFTGGRNKQFTMAIHLPTTDAYEGLGNYNEIPKYANIFATDTRKSGQGFRLSFDQENGYGDLVINCLERVDATTSRQVEFWPLRAGGVKEGTSFVQAQDINLQSCKDLLIVLKMRKTNTGYVKSFDIEVSGINNGVLYEETEPVQVIGTRGEEKFFNIKNSFNTSAVLMSKPRRLVFFGGTTRRNNITSTNESKLLNWSHNNCTIGSIVLWNNDIPNTIINKILARRVYNDQLSSVIIRRFKDITKITEERESILNNCVAYWQGIDNNILVDNIKGNGIKLMYSEADKVAFAGSTFFNRTNWTRATVKDLQYEETKTISSISAKLEGLTQVEEDLGILPFGGFPGTDGYSFRTAP